LWEIIIRVAGRIFLPIAARFEMEMDSMSEVDLEYSEVICRQMVATPTDGSMEWAESTYSKAFLQGFDYIIHAGDLKGDILEFGTYKGFTAHVIAKLMKQCGLSSHLWLYDSFEGFPEIENLSDKQCYLNKKGDWVAGGMSLPKDFERYISDSLQKVIPSESFTIVKGFFEETMDKFLSGEKAVLVHLDCDLYSSSEYVLNKLLEKKLLQDGTLLFCDDYNGNRANPTMGQRGALSKVFNENCRFAISEFFSYSWHGKTFFIHDKETFVL
jgi:O-methyltransferase